MEDETGSSRRFDDRADRRPTEDVPSGASVGPDEPRVVRRRRSTEGEAAQQQRRHPDDRRRQHQDGDPRPSTRRPSQRGSDQRSERDRRTRPDGTQARPGDREARAAAGGRAGTRQRPPGSSPQGQQRRPRPSQTEPDEYVVLPHRTSTPRRILTVIAIVVLAIGIVLGGTLLWASRQINPSGPPGDVVELVTIPKGAATPSIAEILVDKKIISNARIFTMYVGLKKKGGWKAGDYVDFRQHSGFDDAIAVLDAGPIPPASKVVRIVEGSHLTDALEAIAEQMGTVTVEQLQASLDSGEVRSAYKPEGINNWEGLLFPDTYQFSDTDTASVILQKMVTRMDEVLDSHGYDRAQALAGRSPYELITIGSLIERETGQPTEERGKISRVISNRLDAGETLGIDASVLYGLGRSSGELTRSDLDQDTPYNTRIHSGLPPTPIGLPGEASLAAAIEPTPGDWRYYVLTSNDPPSHFFTSSYQEFLNAKNDAQRRGVF